METAVMTDRFCCPICEAKIDVQHYLFVSETIRSPEKLEAWKNLEWTFEMWLTKGKKVWSVCSASNQTSVPQRIPHTHGFTHSTVGTVTILDSGHHTQIGETKKMIECNLCGMQLPDEENRKIRHNEFHSKATIQHRNTTQGYPKWSDVKWCPVKESVPMRSITIAKLYET